MPPTLEDLIVEGVKTVADHYHRLVLVVGGPNTGKTAALRAIANQIGASRINLNLELSRRLLDLTTRQRAIQCPAMFGEVLASVAGKVVLLDNIEMLFDPALQQDPLQHFRAASRNRTLVVAWPGAIRRDGGERASLIYAMPGHPEYRRYPVADLVFVEASAATATGVPAMTESGGPR